MTKLLSENSSKRLLWIGVLLFFIGIIIFIWKESFTTSSQIDSEKIGQFGDFIGGLIGSIWSLAGVILFYVALTEQREDIKINRDALKAQVEALNHQIKEFELQRIELAETRKVFQEQSATLRIQRFENTFFQLLSLHHELVDKLNFDKSLGSGGIKYLTKRGVISEAFNDLNIRINNENSSGKKNATGEIIWFPNEPESIELAKERLNTAYRNFYFEDYRQILSHYFRNIYHIFKFIYKSKLIEPDKKQFYASLVRAQLSSEELFLIFYNIIIDGLGYPNFMFLSKQFDLMQNFDFKLILKYKFHINIYDELITSVNPEFEIVE